MSSVVKVTIQGGGGGGSGRYKENVDFNDPSAVMPDYAHEKIFKEGKCKCTHCMRCDNCLKQMLREEREKREKEIGERATIWEENAE